MKKTSVEEFKSWLNNPEGVVLEFKEAKNQFPNKKYTLEDYCAALSCEACLHSADGAKLILGVTDKIPRTVVGTTVFAGTESKQSHDLFQKLDIRIDLESLTVDGRRVLIFHIPPCYPGKPVKTEKGYLERQGESLTGMNPQTLKRLLNKPFYDFSAQAVPGIKVTDLDDKAVQRLRQLLFQANNSNKNYLNASTNQLLLDLGLKTDKGITYAALILLAKKEVLNELLPQCEIIFEWRQLPGKREYDFRRNWREPFLKIFDEIWDEIGNRNLRTPYLEGFVRREIPAFDQKVIREAILNAVAHRDYTGTGSVFIEASPEMLVITSPGGFLPGITPENVLYKKDWRNRRLAEIFEKTDLIERSGQGINLIFEQSAREGKGLPDFQGTDDFQVVLRVPAQVKDTNFVRFLEKVATEKQISLSSDHIIELERIREHQLFSKPEYKKYFLEHGLIEQIRKTRGTKYILSHNYYTYSGNAGIYTRLVGTSMEKTKELILKHLKNPKHSSTLTELCDIFPELKPKDISNILSKLKKEGKVIFRGGPSRKGRWELLE